MKTQDEMICPLCQGQTESYSYGPRHLALRRCLTCDVVFLPGEQNLESYAQAMEEEFFSENFLKAQTLWQRVFERLNTRRVLKRIQRYKPSGRLLEIGIGSGAFIAAAQKSGFECLAIELSPSIARYAQDTYAVPVFVGYLKEFCAQAAGIKFDVIVMNHVLEHMPDPRIALQQIRGLLSDNGVVHIAVPNLSGWEAKLSGWTAYEPYHLYYFSPATLTHLLKEADFAIKKVETFEPFSGWFNAAMRTVFRNQYEAQRSSVAKAHYARRSPRYILLASLLNAGRVIVGLMTLPLRLMQSRLHRGEELITISSGK